MCRIITKGRLADFGRCGTELVVVLLRFTLARKLLRITNFEEPEELETGMVASWWPVVDILMVLS